MVLASNQILGAVIFSIGFLFLGIGLYASNAPIDQLASAFTGHYTDRIVWYIILGMVAAVTGGLVAAFGLRSRP